MVSPESASFGRLAEDRLGAARVVNELLYSAVHPLASMHLL